MPGPLISVALASYNGVRFIRQQIDSILNQTITDIEIVVSDDLSDDGTLELLSQFQKEGKIKLIEKKERLGVIKNFENALRYCSGQYIAFSDQDDVWFPEKLEKSLVLMKQLEKLHGAYVPLLVFTDAKVADENLQIIHASYLGYKRLDPSKIHLRNILVENVPTGCTMLFNRQLASMVKNIPAEATMHDVFVSLTAAAFGKMAYLNEPTLFYRQHAHNVLGLADKPISHSIQNTWQALTDKSAKTQFLSEEISQAKAFYELFSDSLSQPQKEFLIKFIHLKEMGKMSKLWFLLKHRVFKGYFLRTVNLFIKA